MYAIFRCDASIEIGTGHVMRCLTLANALAENGASCHFICRAHDGHLGSLIEQKGHRVTLLPTAERQNNVVDGGDEQTLYAKWLGCSWENDATACQRIMEEAQADWLVVDHYGLDAQWEAELRPHAKNIMVIDDLANRAHDCDVLLDQNLGSTETAYRTLVPDHCQLFIGPKYALLRPEFAQWRPYSLARRKPPKLERILITMGGVDKDNVTAEVLNALAECLPSLHDKIKVSVVMGHLAPHLEQVQQLSDTMPFDTEVLVGVENMAELMANSDLAIGASGSTSWERCCLGLPSIFIVLADNQKVIAEFLESHGVGYSIPLKGLKAAMCKKIKQVDKKLMNEMVVQTQRISCTDGVQVIASAMRGASSEG